MRSEHAYTVRRK